MDNIIDTAKMRDAAQDTVRNRISPHLRDVWLLTSSHYDGCEYEHYVCAVLKLCDEVDALRAEIAEARAEVERLGEVISTLPEWTHGDNINSRCVLCDAEWPGPHERDCYFANEWEVSNGQES